MQLPVLLSALLSASLFLCSQTAQQLGEQEMNLWSKLELSLLSTQSEIDGLGSLVNSLQQKSEKLTDELILSQADKNKLLLLLENTDSSFRELYSDYENLKADYRTLWEVAKALIWVLAVWIGLKLVRILIGLKFPVLDKVIPRIVDIII